LKRHKLRVVDLAKAADVTWPTAKSWVVGNTTPSIDHVGRVVASLRDKRGITAGLEDFLTEAVNR
jgi:hypothetical protein